MTVSELTFHLKNAVERSFDRVIVRGEVTGFRGPNARGHLYFAIKDAGASLDVRIWQSQARTLKFQLRDGLSLIIEGGLNLYEVQGRYSLIAAKVEPEGVGALALAFEQLKARLTKEGLIGEGRTRPKRPLPFLPRRIGVVTSSSGAAWRDFLKVLHRRHPRVPVLFVNARVQGEDAPIEVARGLRWLSKQDVDVIVVTRGGGSVEDLWTFNEERVVRAIFASPVPVVSAVGHEIDVTLSDLVADYRAPTPSAAAEAIVPVLADLEARLATNRRRLSQAMERILLERRHRLAAMQGALGDPRRQLTSRRLSLSEFGDRLRRGAEAQLKSRQKRLSAFEGRLARARPQAQLAARRATLTALTVRLRQAVQPRARDRRAALHRLGVRLERASPRPRLAEGKRRLTLVKGRLPQLARGRVLQARERLRQLAARLEALSPLAVLGRGYAIATRVDGRVVRRAADVAPGDAISLRLDRGETVQARVESRNRTGEE